MEQYEGDLSRANSSSKAGPPSLRELQTTLNALLKKLNALQKKIEADEYPPHLERLQTKLNALLEKMEQVEGSKDPDRLRTRQEAADYLRVSTRTLDDLEDSGRLQAVRIGRRVLYHPETLEAFVEAQAKSSGE